ncbi:DUF2784 family protein [Candidatus Kaiserbacteria bacterium]|nr:DUF2784 family protein [Candidatus Kaiserbacteria bacterium]
MNSKQMLVLHVVIFATFVAVSFELSYYVLQHPESISITYLGLGTLIFAIIVVGSWPLFGGCLFTTWENKRRSREGRATYTEPCIDHYVYRWIGFRFPGKSSTYMLIVLLVLPLATRVWSWLN